MKRSPYVILVGEWTEITPVTAEVSTSGATMTMTMDIGELPPSGTWFVSMSDGTLCDVAGFSEANRVGTLPFYPDGR